MPLYETIFIARQDVTTAQVETITTQMSELLTSQGATIAKTEQWGLRKLAYRINKNRKGHYTLLHIDGPSAAVQEFERNLKINEDVLRFLTVKVDEFDENPSPVLRKAKVERDSYEGEAA